MRWPLVILAAGLLAFAPPAAAQRQPTDPVDCEGPVSDAEPGTAEWFARDANNLFCTQQRHGDQALHPVLAAPVPGAPFDAYREPSRHDGRRFRFDAATIANRDGEALEAEIYRPCAPGGCGELPEELEPFEPPYPAVVVLHGGGSRKELHWWASQSLAEAGYFVVAFDGATSTSNVRDVLLWLFATPDDPTPAGQHNPFWDELDGEPVGIAGHSIGGDAAGIVGQSESRIGAVVLWDRAGLSTWPDDAVSTPALALIGDYGCAAPLVCPPEPRADHPDPADRGLKMQDFSQLRSAGIDTMQVALRAATHFDWVPSELSGNRYAELVSVYYTLAWFDRYVKGDDDPAVAADAFERLTATEFDDSADVHNISQGFFDPARAAASPDPYAGNVPYRIAGMPVPDRLSFYFRSKCRLTVPGGAGATASSEDMRAEACR